MMRAGLVLAIALIAAGPVASRPDYRRHGGGWGNNNGWHDRWENRRDARRAGVVAGLVVGGIAGAAARGEANRRYEECVMATGYDYECEQRRYYDEMRAREAGRGAGIVAGITAGAIARND
jgi:hypothetical protein